MNVSLTPELEKFVDDKLQSGLYNSASEVISEGLRLLKEYDEDRQNWREQIERGWQEAQRGGVGGRGCRASTHPHTSREDWATDRFLMLGSQSAGSHPTGVAPVARPHRRRVCVQDAVRRR